MTREGLLSQFPGHDVFMHADDALDVYSKDGKYVAAFRKSGAGVWKDFSEDAGCDMKLKAAADQAAAAKAAADKKKG